MCMVQNNLKFVKMHNAQNIKKKTKIQSNIIPKNSLNTHKKNYKENQTLQYKKIFHLYLNLLQNVQIKTISL